MNSRQQTISSGNQKGVVLIVTLLLLIIITLITLSGSRNTTLQLRMASNLQAQIEALQFAQAGLDFVEGFSKTDINLDSGTIGKKFCTNNVPTEGVIDYAANCESQTTSLLFVPLAPMPLPLINKAELKEGNSWVTLEHLNIAPCIDCDENFDEVFVMVTSGYDNTANGQGQAVLSAGYKKLILGRSSGGSGGSTSISGPAPDDG